MAPSDSYDCDANRTRMQAGEFTAFTRFVHPFVDAVVSVEDLDLMPKALRPRGGLKWTVAPGHAKKPKELESRTCTDDLITSLRADLDHMHGKVSQLESFMKDTLSSSNFVSSDPVSEGHCEDDMGSTIQPNSPVTQSVSLCSMTDQDGYAGEACQNEWDESSGSELFADRPLRKRRPFGPYELFWMQNNPYGATEDERTTMEMG